MKRIFTLAALAAFTLAANAQDIEWNFGELFSEKTTYTETTTVNDLKIYANSDKTVVIDSNSKTVDGVKYTYRLKIGGTSAFNDDGTPNYRVLEFTLSKSATIYVVCMNGAGSNTTDQSDRPLNFYAGSGSEDNLIGTIACPYNTATSGTVSFTSDGSETPIYIASGNSGINIYDIQVTYTEDESGEGDGEEGGDTGEEEVEGGSEGEGSDVSTAVSSIEAAEAVADEAEYNLAGQKVGPNYKGIVIKGGKKYLKK